MLSVPADLHFTDSLGYGGTPTLVLGYGVVGHVVDWVVLDCAGLCCVLR